MVLKSKITPVEDWQKAVRDHIDKLDEGDKRYFAHSVIYEIAVWTGYNAYEMIGLLEVIKQDLFNDLNNVEDEDDE
jgi:hypothetical protein